MFFRKQYIFFRLFLYREFPLFKYIISILVINLIFSLLVKTNVPLLKSKKDISYLLKVLEVPSRSKVGEIKFKAKLLGEVKNINDRIEITRSMNRTLLYCKTIELPWKNISDLNVGSIIIGRGELLEIDLESSFSKFLMLNNYSGIFKMKFISLVDSKEMSPYKKYFYDILDRLFLSSEVKALYQAMLFGDKSGLSLSLERNFRNLGLSHLLVVSGFHVGLFFFISSFVLKNIFKLFRGIKKFVSLNLLVDFFSLLITLAYCSLVGFKASCLRALLATFCFVFYKNLGYRATFIHLLSIYFLCFILFNYNLILTLGVKYSFLALIGIMYASFFKLKNKILNYIIVSAFACTFTSLLTLSVFGSYNIISVFTNIVFSPLFILLICKIGFLIIALSLISFDLAKLLVGLIERLILSLFEILNYFASIQGLEIKTANISFYVYFWSLFTIFIFMNYHFAKKYRLKYNI